MAKNIHIVPRQDGWGVLREGNARAGSVHSTQSQAINSGRDAARRDHVELVIHSENGRIRDKDSYGNDPFPPKDRK